jgi:hypothetical protein
LTACGACASGSRDLPVGNDTKSSSSGGNFRGSKGWMTRLPSSRPASHGKRCASACPALDSHAT